MDTQLNVKFWGVRGSHPAPGEDTVLFGGNTACVEVRAGAITVILDAGTGLIGLGRDLTRRSQESGTPLQATLLFSHLHHDHTQGFPFFIPAYHPANRLFLFGPGPSSQALEELLSQNQQPPAFPVRLNEMSAALHIRSLSEQDTLYLDENGPRLNAPAEDALSVRILRSYAHPGGVYIYRLAWRGQSLVYATDTEGYVGGDRRLAAFAHEADLLIHDAQYTEAHYRGQNGRPSTQGYGHSTAEMACELARAANARSLALFHHDPSYTDQELTFIEKRARSLFHGAFAAREGLEMRLSSESQPLFSVSRLARQPMAESKRG